MRGLLVLCLILLALPARAETPFAEPELRSAVAGRWSKLQAPAPGPVAVIGKPAAGCYTGGVALPLDGPGWQVVRAGRNRYYGVPQLIEFIKRLGGKAHEQGFPPIYIADMNQPRGGPMPSGHASHQLGLDTDIWFDMGARPRLPASERGLKGTRSVIVPGTKQIDPKLLGPRQIAMLRWAATDPAVERIFVNPVIKMHLCETEGDTRWLHKLRPWAGHDSHFHVRLNCPPGSTACYPGPAIPAGAGCDSSLFDWFRAPRFPRPKPPASKEPPKIAMPVACEAVRTR